MSRKKTRRAFRNIRITPKGYRILAALDRGTYMALVGRPWRFTKGRKRDARGRFSA